MRININAYITDTGTPLNILAASLTADVDSYCWGGDLTLAREADYNLCASGTAVSLTINGVTWSLIVDSRDRDRRFPAEQYKIAVRGPASNLGEGNATTLLLDADSQAEDIAATLAGAVSLTWDVLDWSIPSGVVVAENVPPITAIQDLASACGALVVSKPDGGLRVSYRHPAAGYDAAEPTETWTDSDILAISDNREIRPGYNRVLCGSEGLLARPVMEITDYREDTSKHTYWLRLRIVPAATPTVTDAAGSHVTIGTPTVVEEEVTEAITIADGVGQTSKAIKTVIDYDYCWSTDLGTITVTGEKEITTATSGDTVLEITYTTEYRQYEVTGDLPRGATALAIFDVPDVTRDLRCDCRRGAADNLSPEVLSSRLCTDMDAAEQWGRNYLTEQGSDWMVRDLALVWPADDILPVVGDVVSLMGDSGRLRALGISYTADAGADDLALQLSATVEVPQ